MSDFKERVKTLRTQRKLTQKQFAADFGIAERAYQYYEAGEREPNMETLKKLCEYFNVSADYLLGLSDDPERK